MQKNLGRLGCYIKKFILGTYNFFYMCIHELLRLVLETKGSFYECEKCEEEFELAAE